MPSGVSWPAVEGRPLAFVAQLDLAELASAGGALGLPSSGSLCFFYDYEGYSTEEPTACVLHFPNETPVRSVPIPDAVPEGYRLPLNLVTYSYLPTLNFSKLGGNFTNIATAEESALLDEYHKQCEIEDVAPYHQVGGLAGSIQNEVELNFEARARLIRGQEEWPDTVDEEQQMHQEARENWLLLLQLDSDPEADLFWGDEGRLFFGLRREDWMKADFSKALAEEQSH